MAHLGHQGIDETSVLVDQKSCVPVFLWVWGTIQLIDFWLVFIHPLKFYPIYSHASTSRDSRRYLEISGILSCKIHSSLNSALQFQPPQISWTLILHLNKIAGLYLDPSPLLHSLKCTSRQRAVVITGSTHLSLVLSGAPMARCLWFEVWDQPHRFCLVFCSSVFWWDAKSGPFIPWQLEVDVSHLLWQFALEILFCSWIFF